MLDLDDYELIASDIPAGGAATLDIYFDPAQGAIIQDKITFSGRAIRSWIPHPPARAAPSAVRPVPRNSY